MFTIAVSIFQRNTHLKHFNLKDSKFTSEGGSAIASALVSNTSLLRLDLEYNDIRFGDYTSIA